VNDLELELALAHASVMFRMLVAHGLLERDCRWLLEHGWDVLELTIVECRLCNKAWVSPLGTAYLHFCQPIEPLRNYTVVPAAHVPLFRPIVP
jgi:hypothetical protein